VKLTREELFEKAAELGIDAQRTEKSAVIAARIEALMGEDIEVIKTPKREKTEKVRKVDDAPKGEETIRCIIHSNDKDNDLTQETFVVNGKNVFVKLGEEIEFPVWAIPAVEDARVEETIAILDDKGQATGRYKKRWRKNYILERLG
jgi:hypothetical protein